MPHWMLHTGCPHPSRRLVFRCSVIAPEGVLMSQAVIERSTGARVDAGGASDSVPPGRTTGTDWRRLEALAARLGIGIGTLEHYLRAHGGLPDEPVGGVAGEAEAVAVAEVAGAAAGIRLSRPSAKDDANWVMRDKPRYFIAG
jgi:hypothetical protein